RYRRRTKPRFRSQCWTRKTRSEVKQNRRETDQKPLSLLGMLQRAAVCWHKSVCWGREPTPKSVADPGRDASPCLSLRGPDSCSCPGQWCTLWRHSVLKRIGLLVITNLAIVTVLSIVLGLLEALGVFGESGLMRQYGPLLV